MCLHEGIQRGLPLFEAVIRQAEHALASPRQPQGFGLETRFVYPLQALHRRGGIARQQRAASALHGLLYVLIFAIPISGYIYTLSAGIPVVYLGLVQLPVFMDPNPEWKPILKEVHYTLNMILLGAFILHVAAALKHLVIDRDGIFKRMLP